MRPIKILPLGLSGAGKTAYLASLYEHLAVPRHEMLFSLQINPKDAQELIQRYREIKDPNSAWPRGTEGGQYKDFDFDCIVSTKSGDIRVFRLLYLDFPGALLRKNMNMPEDPRYFARIESTDAFLVLLDGEIILKVLNGDLDSASELEESFVDVFNLIGVSIRKPLHFIVTKWDILESNYDLSDVRNSLSKIDLFNKVVSYRRRLGRTTRLIPVSAVGKGFARLTDDGRMEKIPRAKCRPQRVHLPISCLVVDLINEKIAEYEENRRKKFSSNILLGLVGLSAMAAEITRSIAIFLPLPSGTREASSIILRALNNINDRLSTDSGKTKKELSQQIDDVKSPQEAFKYLIDSHASDVMFLSKEFPASDLSSGM